MKRFPRGTPFKIRFWALVNKTEDHWLWLGFIDRDGYGRFHDKERKFRNSAAIAWELTTGSRIPNGFEPDHLCKIRSCVNPDHIDPKTSFENNSLAHRKLTESQVLEIREKFQSGVRKSDLSREYNTAYMTITYIVRRESWSWL